MLPTILIGSPVRQRPAVLVPFLDSLRRLNTDGFDVSFALVDDNDDTASSQLLTEFAAQRPCVVLPTTRSSSRYVCDDELHHWTDELIWRVAQFKNELLAHARESGADFVFLVDSDLVLHPATLQVLHGAHKDIVSEVFWTTWYKDTLELPQVWLCDHYSMHDARLESRLNDHEKREHAREFLRKLRVPGLYRVGGLGACTLLSRRALNTGVSFGRIPNVSLAGEDRHFCIRAAVLGLDLFADTHVPAYHIYRDEHLAGVAAYVQACEQR